MHSSGNDSPGGFKCFLFWGAFSLRCIHLLILPLWAKSKVKTKVYCKQPWSEKIILFSLSALYLVSKILLLENNENPTRVKPVGPYFWFWLSLPRCKRDSEMDDLYPSEIPKSPVGTLLKIPTCMLQSLYQRSKNSGTRGIQPPGDTVAFCHTAK